MAELPGWDRTRLATADEPDVEAARWLLYARVLEPQVTFQYDAEIHRIEVMGIEPKKAEAVHREDRQLAVNALKSAQADVPRLRRLLLLDEPDTEVDE